jgi:hypothetical protein
VDREDRSMEWEERGDEGKLKNGHEDEIETSKV